MNLLSAVDTVDATPIDHWIAAQGDLSAVERFSQRHVDEARPLQARYYRDLLPAHAPGPGQQYAFAVDLDACTGCKACVAACHSLNGLDDEEEWRRVTLLTGWRGGQPYQQHVTAACHHCVEPACMHGCPVDAYEKDPITGIVAHLDDQCIGCSYCTLTCPYEVPAYDHRRGIVRKCDLCSGRLAVGEAPACVQGCPNGAIEITVVDLAATVAAGASGALVSGAPPSAITLPSTQYRSTRTRFEDADSATMPTPASAIAVAKAHPPLTVMLVLTQLAVGAFVADLFLRWVSERGGGTLPAFDAVVVMVAGMVALGASVLHLGRPLHSYRAVIGLRHSWLSREVVAFGAFTGLALPYAFLIVAMPDALGSLETRALGVAVAAAGVLGVACSVLIYTRTRRASWTTPSVAAKFALTAAACGSATVLWMSSVGELVGAGSGFESGADTARWLFVVIALLTAAKLGGEAMVLRHRGGSTSTEATRRARVLTGPLRVDTLRRFGVGLVAGVALPLAAAALVGPSTPSLLVAAIATVVLVGIVAGELIERTTFFTAASAPR